MTIGHVWGAIITALMLSACVGGGAGSDSNGNQKVPTTPTVGVANTSVTEGNSGTTDLVFTVSSSAIASAIITVDYTISDGTAQAGSDYSAASGTATIIAGSTSTTVAVTVLADVAVEGDETLTLTLGNPSGATIDSAAATATGTIIDDDGAPPPSAIPNLSMSNTSINEGNSGISNLVFTLTLNIASSSDVTVDYITMGNTATEGSDYAATSGTATIIAGSTSTTINVSVAGDTEVEPDEIFMLHLSNAAGANLLTIAANGTIINDDAAVPVTGGPYSLYRDNQSLYAVDLSDPTKTYFIGHQPVDIENSEIVVTGDLDLPNLALTNLRPDRFVYFDQLTSKFWRIDLGIGSNLTPVQISSATATVTCRVDVVDNPVAPANSYVVFVSGLDQNDCQTNGHAYAMRVGDDSTVAPKNIDGIFALHDTIRMMQTDGNAVGAVTGFLITNVKDAKVTRYDANFANPTTIIPASSFLADRDGGDITMDITFFHADGVLYAYPHSMASTAKVTMHNTVAGRSFDDSPENDFLCNITICYFVEKNTAGIQTVVRAAIDGSGSMEIQTFTTENVLQLALTDGRLYINTTLKAGGGNSLYAISNTSLAGDKPITVDSVTGINNFVGLFGIGEYLYYTAVDESVHTLTAIIRQDDNNVIDTINNANWLGFQITHVQMGTVFAPSVLILGKVVTAPVAGLQLVAYDTATATQGNTLGLLEGAIHAQGVFNFSAGTQLLGRAAFGTPPAAYQMDIFVVDSARADSLQRVTNSASVNEQPLY